MTTTTSTPSFSKAALEIPALFSNGFSLAINPLYSRLSFGETQTTPEEIKFHTSISIATADLKLLAETIQLALQKAHEAAQIK